MIIGVPQMDHSVGVMIGVSELAVRDEGVGAAVGAHGVGEEVGGGAGEGAEDGRADGGADGAG